MPEAANQSALLPEIVLVATGAGSGSGAGASTIGVDCMSGDSRAFAGSLALAVAIWTTLGPESLLTCDGAPFWFGVASVDSVIVTAATKVMMRLIRGSDYVRYDLAE